MSQACDSTLTLAGMDGGGTRTRLALARGDGCVFGFAETGCCSFVELGRERAREAMQNLWQSAWESTQSPPRPVDALFIGAGSILSAADARINCELALSIGCARPGKVRAENDAFNAHAGALLGRPGLLLISGTGSVCFGRNQQGQCWRAGGWGHLLGERGSAHALGLAALVAATRAADGRGQPTALSSLALEKLHLNDLKEIYRKLHHDGLARSEIAALAPSIVELAGAGDAVANKLLDQAAEGLLEMVSAAASRLGLKEPTLALRGGLITQAVALRRRFLDRLGAQIPGFTLAEDGLAPVFGSVMLACQDAAGAPPTAAFVENLRRSIAERKLAT